ncbi:MAG TPA: TonB-dependent receptor, partial [Bryobacteraceae bacterium]|nr:TonB-dependent receptor [Bryobacteraceae bacterium]
DFRVDHYFGSRDSVFMRGSFGNDATLIPPPYTGFADGGPFNAGNQLNTTHSYAFSWTRVISPTLVNEARAGYTHIYSERYPPFGNDLTNIPGKFGIQGIPQVAGFGGLPTFNVTGLSQFGTTAWIPTNESGDTVQMNDNITAIVGKHSLKTGFQFQQPEITFFQPRNANGAYTYSGAFTEVSGTSGANTGLAQLLLNPIASGVQGGINNVGGPDSFLVTNKPSPTPAMRWQTYAAYVEDSWKVFPNLTVNVGVRWEAIKHGVVPGGYGANFLMEPSPQLVMTSDQCKKGLSPSYLSLMAKDGVAINCSDGNRLIPGVWSNFGPRVGLSYHFLPRMVFRAGFGMSYGNPNQGDVFGVTGNYPYSYQANYASPDPGHPIVFPNGQTATLESGLTGVNINDPTNFNATNLGVSGIAIPYQVPTVLQYSATIQTQLSNNQTLSVGYVGTGSRHLVTTIGYNTTTKILPPGLNLKNYIPFPDFGNGSMSLRQSWGNSNYNGLQVTYQKRFSSGLSGQANYTWSKCRTDARQPLINGIGGNRAPLLANFGIHADYALCDIDSRDLAHLSGTYELPMGTGKMLLRNASPLVDAALGGWSMNFLATLQSGPPFTIGCPVGTTTGYGCNAFLVPGQDLYAGPHDVNQWMSPAAFSQPPKATAVGQSDYAPLGGAPTQVRAPGYHRADISLFKNFRIRETSRLEFRAECFNLTNTPQFGIPGFTGPGLTATPGVTDFTNTRNFGKITSVRDGPNDQREIQVALKLYF